MYPFVYLDILVDDLSMFHLKDIHENCHHPQDDNHLDNLDRIMNLEFVYSSLRRKIHVVAMLAQDIAESSKRKCKDKQR
jgi:hypothetical protein